VVLPAGTRWWRGTTHPAAELVPGAGNTRFDPLPDTQHAYFGATKAVALLESALHAAIGPSPTIYLANLHRWTVHEVELTHELRLADLRDTQLLRLGLTREQLVNTTVLHYPCTRLWAEKIQTRRTQRDQFMGVIWHSRQADLHADANPDGLLADVLRHTPAEVAVMWHPQGPPKPFRPTGTRLALIENGRPTRLVEELAALIGAALM
jgi:hypothetical protein